MKKAYLFSCLYLLLLASLPLAAAEMTPTRSLTPTCSPCSIILTGKVTNEAGNPVVSASVQFNNGNTHTTGVTDSNGNYSFTSGNCQTSSTMVVTATGYVTQTVAVTSSCSTLIRNFMLVAAGSLKGDVNGDGTVTIVDALATAQYFVGLNPANFNRANADVNCDSQITIVDALMIAQYYVGLISPFTCVVQPTPTPTNTVSITPTPMKTACPCAISMSGYITNAVTGAAIAGATVTLADELMPSQAQTTSDATGFYRVMVPVSCTVKLTLIANATGYTGGIYKYEGGCGSGTMTRDFALQPAL